MALNQRVAAPYGDITIFNTPKTDRFIAQHQLEERQQELQRQKEIDEADKQLSSHLGNILNPDIPDVVSGWQDYKNAKKQLLFDANLQKDPNAYAQKQMEVNTKLANVLNTIGSSSKRKQGLYQQLQDARQHPERYEDNAAQRIMMGMNTPSSFAMQHPDFDNHRWQGPNMDFTKSINDAAGKEGVIQTIKTPIGTNGEQSSVVDIKGKANPESFLSALNQKKSDRLYSINASKTIANTDPSFIQKVNDEYAAMPEDKFKKWGLKEKPNLDPEDPNNPVDVFNSLQAKSHALHSELRETGKRDETNYEVRRANQLKSWKEKLGIKDEEWKQHEIIRQRNRIIVKSTPSAGSAEKAKQDDDATMWVSLGPEILKNGTDEQKKAYLGNLLTGGAKGVRPGDIDIGATKTEGHLFDAIKPTAKKTPSFTYNKIERVQGEDGKYTWQEVPHEIKFDGDDAHIQERLVEALNISKGTNLKLTRKNWNMDKVTTPASKGKKEVDVSTKAQELIDKYSQQ